MSETIFFSPVTSVFSNKPPGTLITGVPGSGKSFCMVNMAAMCLEQGCRIFALDAKNDMINLRNLFPDIKVTDINRVAPGSLDPFLVFDHVDATIITTIVQLLCGELDSTQKLAITPIIDDFITRAITTKSANFRDFANYLYQHQNEAAQLVGNQLLINARTRYGGLIFGQEGKRSRGIRFGNDNRIISIFGMRLPQDNSTPKPDEMLASAVVYIITRMMEDLMDRKGRTDDRRPTVIFLDECHELFRSPAIKDTVDRLLILGRSLGVAVVMASQNVTHWDEKIAQLVATKFCFNMSKKEAQVFFDLFDNTTIDNELDQRECVEIATRLQQGYCFMIDSSERCSLIHITSMYSKDDINSNPLFKKRAS